MQSVNHRFASADVSAAICDFRLMSRRCIAFQGKFFAVACVLICLLLPACQRSREPAVLNNGDPVPLFRLKDLAGRDWSLEQLRGKVVLINFWAPWCPPCREEMPSLQRLSKEMKGVHDFVILTILYKGDALNADRFVRQNGLNLTVLLDESVTVPTLYGVTGVPETFIVDKKGALQRKIIGPTRFDAPEMTAFIKCLLHESA